MVYFRWRCAQGTHPFPSRTRWLRPKRPMVLCWRRHGRAGGCQIEWGCSSVGRAPALQAGGQGFESLHLHCVYSTHSRCEPRKHKLPRSWHYMPMHLNLQPLRNASIPHGSKSKRARIFMYLENCIQKIQNIFNTKDTRHPRKNQKCL